MGLTLTDKNVSFDDAKMLADCLQTNSSINEFYLPGSHPFFSFNSIN